MGNEASRTQTGTPMGCQHERWRLNSLSHGTVLKTTRFKNGFINSILYERSQETGREVVAEAICVPIPSKEHVQRLGGNLEKPLLPYRQLGGAAQGSDGSVTSETSLPALRKIER